VIIIAAVSADGFISQGTGVPWDLPEDRQHFRTLTQGQWLLLGRRTFEEMLGWFRDHHPLVLTRRPLPAPWEMAGVECLEAALAKMKAGGGRSLWICGGAAAYAMAMPQADELILTVVAEELGDGVAFPVVDESEWQMVRQEVPTAGSSGPGPTFEWRWYERVRKAGGAR
jgi:dihydrofolate reductase